MSQVLPPDTDRALVYTTKNFTEIKTLLPDGSVVDRMPVDIMNNLVPESYDEISLSYTGGNLTGVVYKKSNATVATLLLGYDGSDNLISVKRV